MSNELNRLHKISARSFYSVGIHLLWTLISSILIIEKIIYTKNDSLFYIGLLSLLSIIILTFTTKMKTNNLITPYFIFLVLSYIFHFGQLLLILFNIPLNSYERFQVSSYNYMYLVQAASYALIGLNIFHLSGLLLLKRNHPISELINHDSLNTSNSRLILLNKFGILLFCITIIPTIYVDISQIIKATELGYVEAYKYGNSYLLSLFTNLFPISLVALLITWKKTKKWEIIYYGVIAWNIIKMVLVGNRSYPIALIIMLFLIKHRFVKPYTRKDYISLSIYGSVFIVVLGFIASIRNLASKGNIINELVKYVLTNNPFIVVLNELGGTLITLIISIIYIPSAVSYANGLTYIGSISIILPFSTHIFGDMFERYISLGEVLNSYFGGGLGGSYIAETYFNFGWYGIILMFIYGGLLAKYTNLFYSSNNQKSLLLQCGIVFMLYPLMLFPRGYFYTWISYINIFIYSSIIYLLIKILYRALRYDFK